MVEETLIEAVDEAKGIECKTESVVYVVVVGAVLDELDWTVLVTADFAAVALKDG